MRKQLSDLNIWTPTLSSAWQLPNELTVSEWADRYRRLNVLMSAEPGQWRTDRTAYLRGIMDAFVDPLVERITIMSSTQVGKTEGMLNMLAYAIDQDPGPALWVMPREPDAKWISKNRVRPMIDDSEQLRAHETSDSDDLTKMELKLDRMIVYFAGANSPAGLAGKPVRYLFFDETDKYPRWAGEEADPIKLGTERTHTFWNRKVVECSTPTVKEGYIYREYDRSDKRSFFVPCPYCKGYQVLTKDQIKVPEGERDTDKIRQERIAWYECLYCKGRISDRMKQGMLLKGVWLPAVVPVDGKGRLPVPLVIPPTGHVGFHLNALYSPWITFSEVIAEWFDCGDRLELMMNFINSWLAQIWEERSEETKPERLKRLCLDYDRGTVPEGAIVLTGGVDVQKTFFVVTIRAWGVHPESWLVLEEVVDTWESVEEILFETEYPSVIPGLPPFVVRLSCFDTGYRTSEVYDICRRHRGLARAIKGKDVLTGVPYKVAQIDKFPGKGGRQIPGGLLLYLLDTTYFKDKIARMVHADEPLCRWHLHRSPSPDYLKWFCGEHKVLKRERKRAMAYEVWQPVTSHAKTHYWDAEVYAAAAAEMLRTHALREEDIPKIIKVRPIGDKEPEKKWLPKRKGWIRNG